MHLRRIKRDWQIISPAPFQLDAALEEVVDNVVILQQVDRLPDITSSEGYVLEVTPKQVKIRAASGAGLFLWCADIPANGE